MKERLGWTGAWLVGWGSVAVVNAVVIARLPRGAAWVELVHHAYDLGLLAAIAVGTVAVTTAWRRWAPASRGWATLAVAVVAAATALVALAPDFTNLAERRDQPWLPWILAVAASAALPAAYLLGSCAGTLGRPRWALAPAAALAATANHLVLGADYPGHHLLLVTTGASLTASALVGAALPGPFARVAARIPRPVAVGARGAVVILAATATVVWPPSRVLVRMWQTDGTILMPFLARLRGTDAEPVDEAEEAATRVPSRWRQRGPRPDQPPSTPALLPDRPLVVVVTLDAVRAEVLTEARYRDRLPHLAQLAAESVHFRVARAPAPTTRNSLAQVFSGKYGAQLRWGKRRGIGRHLLEDDTPHLSDLLGASGFRTLHVTGYAGVGASTGVVGRFDEEQLLSPAVAGQRFPLAEQSLDVALGLLDRDATRATYLYMHWMDAHDPYDAAGTEGSAEERWFREVQRLDEQIGRLRRELASRGLTERTALVVAADHGEALGDHGIPHHGRCLYESLVRVPLMVKVPGVRPRVVDAPVSLLDLGPTVLDLASLPVPGHWMGQSLVPYLRGDDPVLDRPIVGDTGLVRSLVLGRYKVIDDRRKQVIEIYDLERDPREETNLVGTLGDEERRLVGDLHRFFRAIRRSKGEEDTAED